MQNFQNEIDKLIPGIFVLVGFAIAGMSSKASAFVVWPRDHGKAVRNPGMGWNYNAKANNPIKYCDDDEKHSVTLSDGTVLGSYSPSCQGLDNLDAFPGVSSAMVRLGWNYFEEPNGDTTWGRVEPIRSNWSQVGKKIALTFVTCDPFTYLWDPNGVTDEGAPETPRRVMNVSKGWYINRTGEGTWATQTAEPPHISPYQWTWCPDYGDSAFLANLEGFIQKAASKYNGNPDVDFVEIGSIGTFGEGHDYLTGRKSPDTAAYIAWQTKLKHLRLWKQYFPNTTLIVGDAYGITRTDQPNQASEAFVLDSAAAMGIGFADHTLLVHQDSGEYYSSRNLSRKFHDSLPVVLEPGNGFDLTWGMIKAVREYRASYVRINNEYKKILVDSRAIVDSINKILGYRLQVRECKWNIYSARSKVQLKVKIRNGGVARCYKGGFLAVHLVRGDSTIVATKVDSSFNVRTLQPMDSLGNIAGTIQRTIDLSLPGNEPPNNLSIYVSVGALNGAPTYMLPYKESSIPKLYKMGKLRKGFATPTPSLILE